MAGATIGKRLLRLSVTSLRHQRVSFGQALTRTAIKLLPWELVHLSAFAASTDLNQLSMIQTIGLGAANLLILLFVLVAVFNYGARSVHDFVAGTAVARILIFGITPAVKSHLYTQKSTNQLGF